MQKHTYRCIFKEHEILNEKKFPGSSETCLLSIENSLESIKEKKSQKRMWRYLNFLVLSGF